jgi:hypothetical protein
MLARWKVKAAKEGIQTFLRIGQGLVTGSEPVKEEER